MFKLTEFDIKTKLDLLCAEYLFPLAMNIITQPSLAIHNTIHSENMSDNELSNDMKKHLTVEICKKYADHLYSKGDFDGAVKHYTSTIGSIEPSYVICKFLDAQRIPNLAMYLQSLHESKLANVNHTTLLLNCYTQLNNTARIDEFIESETLFDFDAAIRVCRRAGLFEQALALAKRHGVHDSYIHIQIEDLKSYEDAIAYLSTLDIESIRTHMSRYGYDLVTHRPEFMVGLMNELIGNDENLDLDEILGYFINQPRWCTVFLEQLLSARFNLHLPDPNQIRPVQISNSKLYGSICNALIQLYTSLLKTDVKWSGKILQLLMHPYAIYDIDQSLIHCKQANFTEGLVCLYEKLGMYKELLEAAIERGDKKQVIKLCHQFGYK